MPYVDDIDKIVTEVCAQYDIPLTIVLDTSQRSEMTNEARHVICYLTKKFSYLSQRELAEYLEIDRATLFYGFNAISKKIRLHDAGVTSRVDKVIKALEKATGKTLT